jgi:nucleoside-diphosphate-sugar epimerase
VRSSWGPGFESYLRNNVLATQRVLEACKETGVRKLVYASSSSVYGNSEQAPTGEDAVPRPVSPYGASKLAAEELCRLYHANFGVPAVVLRYFTVYGPRQRPDMAFNRFIAATSTGRKIEVFGDGHQKRDFTYVSDVVRATLMAAGARDGQIYNVGSGSPRELLEAISLISDAVGKSAKLKHSKAAEGDVRNTYADVRRIRKELGWAPRVSLKEGIRLQVEWQLVRKP